MTEDWHRVYRHETLLFCGTQGFLLSSETTLKDAKYTYIYFSCVTDVSHHLKLSKSFDCINPTHNTWLQIQEAY